MKVPRKNLFVKTMRYVEEAADPWGTLAVGRNKWMSDIIASVFKDKQFILDLGAGFGHYSDLLKGQSKDMVPLDASGRMIREGHRLYPGLQFVQGEALNLPFTDATFDGCLCMGTLLYVGEVERALQEVRRVLKDDGLLLLIDRNKASPYHALLKKLGKYDGPVGEYANFFTLSQLRRYLKKGHWQVEKVTGDFFVCPYGANLALVQRICRWLGGRFPSIAYFLVLVATKNRNSTP